MHPHSIIKAVKPPGMPEEAKEVSGRSWWWVVMKKNLLV